MTSQSKRKLTNLGIGGAAILAVVGWGVPTGANASLRAVDGRYVRTDTFRVYQQGMREKAITDSTTGAFELREIRHILAGLDSSDRCRRGFRMYCR